MVNRDNTIRKVLVIIWLVIYTIVCSVFSKPVKAYTIMDVENQFDLSINESVNVTQFRILVEDPIIIPDKPKTIDDFISEVCNVYQNFGQALIKSIIYHESRFNPNETTGNCVGLMQVSTYWHKDRAEKLGVTDFYDPYSNILLGVDYLSELLDKYKDIKLVLMLYNMNHDTAFRLYKSGQISWYARSVLEKAEEYKKGE